MYSNNVIREDDSGYAERSLHRSDCIMLPSMGINYTSFQFEQPLVNKVNLWTFRDVCLYLTLYTEKSSFVGKCLRSLINARAKADVKFILIIIISNLSNDRSKASSKTIPPHSAI